MVLSLAVAVSACDTGSPELKALCAAVESANVSEVRTLLQKGGVDLNADQQQTSGRRCRPFKEAMAKVVFPDRVTELAIVRLMLDAGADPSSCWAEDRGGGSTRNSSSAPTPYVCAIQYAVRSGAPDFVNLVMEKGANVKGGGGAAALKDAALLGYLPFVKRLVGAGAPLNEVPRSATDPGSAGTALGAAVRGHYDDVVDYLDSQQGAREFPEPSALSGAASAVTGVLGGQGGLTAAEQAFMTGARRGDLVAVNAALASGIGVDRFGDDALSALMRAAGWGRTAVVAALLKAGAKPDLINDSQTALHHAAARGHVDVISLLVAARANVNARSNDTSDTPLLAAVKGGHPNAVRALIDAGADTSARELTMTPLEYAIWRADTAVVRELVKDDRTPVNARHASAKESPLHGALWCKNPDYNVELIETLISAGASLSAVDQNGDTPLKAVERKRSAEPQPYYQGCYDAQLIVLRAAAAR